MIQQRATKAPARVMFLVGSLSTGGAERFVANVVHHLDRSRFTPYLGLYRAAYSYAIPEDVPICILHKYKPWHNPAAANRLRRWIDQVRPQILLSAWSVPNVFAAATLRFTRHRPVWIARIANNPSFRERGAYGVWARMSYRRADRFIAVCRGLCDAFEQTYPFAAGRSQVIYNAVDLPAIKALAHPGVALAPPGVVHLVTAGRLHRQKRFDIMLRAVAAARRSARIHLHILGDGEDRDHLRALAATLGIADHVTWHGFVDNPYPLYQGADIFLLTSDYEGLSNALLESQALGLPAIATNCPFGNEEVLTHNENGLLADVGAVDQIAQHIITLSNNESSRIAMGTAAARRIANTFSIDKMVHDIEALLDSFPDCKN